MASTVGATAVQTARSGTARRWRMSPPRRGFEALHATLAAATGRSRRCHGPSGTPPGSTATGTPTVGMWGGTQAQPTAHPLPGNGPSEATTQTARQRYPLPHETASEATTQTQRERVYWLCSGAWGRSPGMGVGGIIAVRGRSRRRPWGRAYGRRGPRSTTGRHKHSNVAAWGLRAALRRSQGGCGTETRSVGGLDPGHHPPGPRYELHADGGVFGVHPPGVQMQKSVLPGVSGGCRESQSRDGADLPPKGPRGATPRKSQLANTSLAERSDTHRPHAVPGFASAPAAEVAA